MAIVTVFKNQHGNVNVALKSGAVVPFISGKFWTEKAALAAELMQAAEEGEFGIYVDSNEHEIDTEFASPMDQLKKKFREEHLAELAAQGKLVDGGTYDGGGTQALQASAASTTDIVGAETLTAEQQATKDAQLEALKLGADQSPLAKLNALKQAQ